MRRSILFITRSDLSLAPYPELALPALARAGWEISVLGQNATQSVYQSALPYPSRAIDLDVGTSLTQEIKLLRRIVSARFEKYGVIYVNGQSLSLRAAFALLGPRLGKRYVYHNADYYSPLTFPMHYRFEKRFSRMADLCINNEFHRAYITYTDYKCRGPMITLPPNLPRAWPVPGRSSQMREAMTAGNPDAFVIMLHGGFSKLRCTEQLISALALLPDRFRLIMTGRTQARDELDVKLVRAGLGSRVTRLPVLGFRALLEYTVNADAGVLFYSNNDLGNFFTAPGRLTEYLACGLPVITSDHTGLEHLVLKYRLGVAVNSADPKAIAKGIMSLAAEADAGAYPTRNQRSVFEDCLAFDHWEPIIASSFDHMMDSRRRACPPPYPWIASSAPTPS